MPSPTCTVNASATSNGVNVTASSLITIALADTAGVSAWSIECIGTDDNNVAATINAALTVNQTTKTAEHAGVAAGSALIFRSRVNNGRDVNGDLQSSYETTFGVYVLTSGARRVIAVNETTEGSASFGWVVQANAAIRSSTLSSGVPNLGYAAVSMTADANHTVSAANYANHVLAVTSTVPLTATRDLILPLVAGAIFKVFNNTTGAQSIRAIAASGTGVTIAPAATTAVYCDGTNYRQG
jgi:hypothetical protein